MIVITKIIDTPAMTGTMIYVTGRFWVLSSFDSVSSEEPEVDSLLVGKDIAVEYRGVDIVRVLSTKIKDSYNI